MERRDEGLSDTDNASDSGAPFRPPLSVDRSLRAVHFRAFVAAAGSDVHVNTLRSEALTDDRSSVTCRRCLTYLRWPFLRR